MKDTLASGYEFFAHAGKQQRGGREMRLRCSRCGKSVSTEVPDETVVRAWIECPECVEKHSDEKEDAILALQEAEDYYGLDDKETED